MGRLKLWLACLLPVLAAAVIFLAVQSSLVNAAFSLSAVPRHAQDLQTVLLRTEIPLLLLVVLAASAAQYLLAAVLLRPSAGTDGLDKKLGDLAGKNPRNLYDEVLSLYKSVITDEQTGAVVYKHFRTMLDLEFSRSRRYKLNFSLVKISVENRENFKTIFPKVAFCVTSVLRNVDITSVNHERAFVILLPNTKKTSAEIAVRRIWTRVRSLEEQTTSKIRLVAGISTFSEDADTLDGMFQRLDANLEKARMLGPNMIVF